MVIDLDARHSAVLGRAPDDPSMPPIFHPTVSRAHLCVEWDAPRRAHVVRDLGSRNGSMVDGEPLGEGWRVLEPGAVLRVGDVLFVYETARTLDVVDPAHIDRDAVPGDAAPVRELRALLARAAPDISPALVIGETGTGKERLAAELHRASGRKGAFVAINCATLGEQLIESQLFGHRAGAFTGATSDREGLFQAARGGTLFLDEIGELPMDLQPKLLRAIQEREIRPLGSTTTLSVDVRIVAATHRELPDRIRSGSFRQDLYARLALWQLRLPSLRERRSDLLSWLDRLARIWATTRDQPIPDLRWSAEAAQIILLAPWPENLRGLDRLVHELAAGGDMQDVLRKRHLPSWVSGGAS